EASYNFALQKILLYLSTDRIHTNITKDRIFSNGLKLQLKVLIDPLQINKYQDVSKDLIKTHQIWMTKTYSYYKTYKKRPRDQNPGWLLSPTKLSEKVIPTKTQIFNLF
ncbi:hypothetical protein GIB67_024382, partial [Kingdonia uniflora]